MLDVRKLALLRDLAVLGTITAVARARSFSPAAVSQQLSSLERETHTRLLDRTGKRVTLTPAAQALVGRAEGILAAIEQAEAELVSGSDRPFGTARIAVFRSTAGAVMPLALARMSVDCPQIEVQLTESQPSLSIPRLRAGEFDVVLTHSYDLVNHKRHSDLELVELYAEPLLLARPAALPQPRALSELADVDWVCDAPGTDCNETLRALCGFAGFAPRVRHQVHEFSVALALVAAGQGYALIPELAMRPTPTGVEFGPVPQRALGRRILAAYRRGTGEHPVVRATVDALRGVFGELSRTGG